MLHPRTLVGRTVSLATVAALATNACASGVSYSTGTLAGLIGQVFRTNPGPYTDLPREPHLGDNPKREPRTRGGVWDDKSLRAIDSASPLLASLETGLFFSAPVSAESGGPYAWEGSSDNSDGQTNTANGNKLSELSLLSWKVRGGMELGFGMFHNSEGTVDEELGKGWTWTYSMRVTEYEDPETGAMNAIVRYPDARAVPYTNSGGTYTAPAGIYDTLTKSGGVFTLKTKKQVSYGFNSSGRLTTVTDRNSQVVTIARNGSQLPTSVTDPTGRVLSITLSGSRIASITDPLSRTWSFTYNGSGQLTTVTHPLLGGVSYTDAYTYNTGNDILTHTDRRGKVWTCTYNADGSLASEKTPLNHTTTYSYTSSATTVTSPLGKTSTDNYSSGKLASAVDESSFSETYTWNGSKQLTSLVDKRGKTWAYTYDSKGNVLTKTDPLSHVWTYTYNSKNDVLTAKNPLNQTYTLTYDTPGNLLTVTDPLSRVAVTNTYDTYGQLSSTKNALNETTSLTYTTNGHLASSTDPLSHTTSFAVNGLGWVTSTTDPLSNVESVSYDEWGRPTTYTHPGSVTETVAYNPNGQVTSKTNELSKTESYVYDDSGRLTSFTNRKGDVESYAYNSDSLRTSVTNGRGKTRTYTYTNRGEVRSLTMPDSAYEEWSYTGNGDTSAYTNPLNQTISYTYDNASRHTLVDYPTGTDTSFGYDNANRRTSMADSIGTTSWTYNAAGEVTALNTPQGNLTYTYSNAGRRATMVETGLGTTSYSYDSAGRLTTLTNPFSEATTLQWDDGGRLTKKTFSTGQYCEFAYDARHRTTSVAHKRSDHTAISSESYVWNAASNLSSKTVGGVTTSYTYDDAHQILSESRSGYSASYTYDGNGNRLTKTLNGTTDTYSYDDGDKLTSVGWLGGYKNYTYDAAGRTTAVATPSGTTTLAYDYESRLTSISYPGGATNTFTYNGLDTRVGKVDSAGTKTFKRDGAYTTDTVLSDSAANYTPGISERRSGASKFYGTDYLGTGSLVTDSSQSVTDTKVYDAFGMLASWSGSTPTPFGFAGQHGYQEDSDSGLKLLGHRYYDPSLGRFITRDSAKDGRNWYVYADSSPNRAVDPDGHWVWFVVLLAIKVYDIYSTANDIIQEPENPWNYAGVVPIPGAGAGKNLFKFLSRVVKRGSKVVKKACFVAGTLILMANGTSKPIEQVKAGDQVATRSEHARASDPVKAGAVAHTFVRQAPETLKLTFADGSVVETTAEHPFFVPGQGFVPANRLATGTRIAKLDGCERSVARVESVAGPKPVYNFEVAEDHTYFVLTAGGEALWVHNDCGALRLSGVVDPTPGNVGKRVPSKKLRAEWEKVEGKAWPKDEVGRNYDVSHKKALADGGDNSLGNIEPLPHEEHVRRHIENGDFGRWGARRYD